MNKLEFRGRITQVLPVQSGETGKGEWKSIDFVVSETSGDYPQSAVFRLFGLEKVDNFQQYNKEGQDVIVSFNLKAREHKSRFFNSLDAWKVFKDNDSSSGDNSQFQMQDEELDDGLPF